MATKKNVDFSNVKDGGGFNKHRVPEGDYLARVVKVEDAESKSDQVFQYLFTVKLEKFSGYGYPYYCKLSENQLWKLRNLAIAAGLNVPKKRVAFDPNKVIGKLIGVTMEDDEYEGKEQSVVQAVFPAAELMDGTVVEDDDAAEGDVEDDEGDEDEVEPDEDEGDAYDEMDRTQLKAALKSLDAGFVAKKSQTDDDLRTLLREGSDDVEEEDEEEEPAPAPKKAAAKAPAKAPAKRAAAKKPAADVSDEELEELDIDDI